MTRNSATPFHRRIAVTLIVTAMMASSLPAEAQRYRHGGYHGRPVHQNYRRDRRGNDNGKLVAGALLGVVAGAIIANSNNTPQPPPEVVYRSNPPPPPPGVVYYDDDGY
jgi:hypothetical protein